MKTIILKCPDCGATLEIENGHQYCYCQYCGSKIILDDESIKVNITYEKHDTARIKEAEVKATLKLKELELIERQEKRDIKIGLICGLGIPLLIITIVLFSLGINKFSAESQGKISAGYCKDYVGQNYEAVVTQFEELGFENIVTIDLDGTGIAFWRIETVKSVSINEKTDFESIHYFYPDDKVVITYH